jgi:PilZ domain
MDLPETHQTEIIDPDTPESHREKARDSLFLSAEVIFDDSPKQYTVRIRNISAGGMMIDVTAPRDKGLGVTATLKNIGEVRGKVVWSTAKRIGITFEQEIDPNLARHKATAAPVPGYNRPYVESRRPGLAIR